MQEAVAHISVKEIIAGKQERKFPQLSTLNLNKAKQKQWEVKIFKKYQL